MRLVVFAENGFVEKAVNYAGEMFIIEEIRLYKTPEPIRTLRLSSSKVTRTSCLRSGVMVCLHSDYQNQNCVCVPRANCMLVRGTVWCSYL